MVVAESVFVMNGSLAFSLVIVSVDRCVGVCQGFMVSYMMYTLLQITGAGLFMLRIFRKVPKLMSISVQMRLSYDAGCLHSFVIRVTYSWG